MSKSSWIRCPATGISKSTLARADECFLISDNEYNTNRHERCNIFNKQEIAREAGFSDSRHFFENVVTHPSSPFHIDKTLVTDPQGCDVETVWATNTNSVHAGKQNYKDAKASDKFARNILLNATDCTSVHAW